MSTETGNSASDSYIGIEIDRRLTEIEQTCNADVITCIAPIIQGVDDVIRGQLDELRDKKKDLLVVLETGGGSAETTERIADVFRHHYSGEVSFIIPNFAMSAGTILVMSGDRILMDYYSILGPIDPQIPAGDGGFLPGLGYIEKFNELIEASKLGQMSPAEMAFLLDKFDPVKLHWLEQAREHGVDLLKKWLVQYKFKNWATTETNGHVVTAAMKEKRAEEIATKLNSTTMWRSHARGLSLNVVRDQLNLKVEDYGTDQNIKNVGERVMDYYRLLKDYMGRRGWNVAIQTRQSKFTT